MLRRTILLLAFTLTGAAGALLVMPRIVRWSRDDTSRICTILDACRSGNAPPAVVLGDSVGMFGVDARQLHAWNFCSPAQTLGESLLLQRELPPNVTTVVQIVTQPQLASDVDVKPDDSNAMQLCGPCPSLAARFDGRRHVRAGLEGLARDVLRRDPDRERLVRDLYFPAPAAPRGGRLPERRFAELADERYVVREKQLQFLRDAARGRTHYLVVLAPIHPRLRRDPPRCPPALDCVDLTTLLSEREFQDPMHATRAGAMRLTAAIRGAMTARRLLSD